MKTINIQVNQDHTASKRCALFFILMAVCWLIGALFAPPANAQAQIESFKATGWQSLTQNDLEKARLAALDDALQKAVSLAVMAHRPEALTGPKAQVVMANVLSRRNQLITRYRVLSEEATSARYKITVTADIRIDQLTTLLKSPSDPVPPPSTPAIKEKIVIFIHEKGFEQAAPANPSERVDAILAEQLRQAGVDVNLMNTSPTTFTLTDVFMQTPLFAHQALALGRQQQADKVILGITEANNANGRLTATIFDVAKDEAVATIQSDVTDGDENDLTSIIALRFKLGKDAAHQVQENLKTSAPQKIVPEDLGILVKVITGGNLKRLVAFRKALAQLGTVQLVQLVEMTTDAMTLSVSGPISAQSLSQSVTHLPMVASVALAPENLEGIQIDVVLSHN